MQLLLFDVDGTLVDSQHDIVEAQGCAFAAHGLAAPSRERALSVVGLSLPEAFAALAGADGPVESLSRSYIEAWTKMRQQPGYNEMLFPGIEDRVADLSRRADVRLGLATGKSRRGVDLLLEACGWSETFVTIQTADEHPSKPHPSMVLAALAETGFDPADAVVIGDTSYDMAMAKAAGVRGIGVAWGYHADRVLLEAGAEIVVADVAALRARLERVSRAA